MGVRPFVQAVTVSTAGSRVQVQSSSAYCTQIIFEAKLANGANNVFVGDVSVSSSKYMTAMTGGERIVLSLGASPVRPSDSNGGPEMQLNSFYLDAQTAGAVCMITYFQRVGVS